MTTHSVSSSAAKPTSQAPPRPSPWKCPLDGSDYRQRRSPSLRHDPGRDESWSRRSSSEFLRCSLLERRAPDAAVKPVWLVAAADDAHLARDSGTAALAGASSSDSPIERSAVRSAQYRHRSGAPQTRSGTGTTSGTHNFASATVGGRPVEDRVMLWRRPHERSSGKMGDLMRPSAVR